MHVGKKVRTHGRSPAHARAWVRHPRRGAERSARLPAARGGQGRRVCLRRRLCGEQPLGQFARVGGGQGRVRAGKFFARSRANLDGTFPGRSVELADGAGKQGKRPARRHLSLYRPGKNPSRSEPDENFSSREGRNGRKKLPASKEIPAFYSGDIYDSNVQLCYTFVYLNCPLSGTFKCPINGTIVRLRSAAFWRGCRSTYTPNDKARQRGR